MKYWLKSLLLHLKTEETPLWMAKKMPAGQWNFVIPILNINLPEKNQSNSSYILQLRVGGILSIIFVFNMQS